MVIHLGMDDVQLVWNLTSSSVTIKTMRSTGEWPWWYKGCARVARGGATCSRDTLVLQSPNKQLVLPVHEPGWKLTCRKSFRKPRLSINESLRRNMNGFGHKVEFRIQWKVSNLVTKPNKWKHWLQSLDIFTWDGFGILGCFVETALVDKEVALQLSPEPQPYVSQYQPGIFQPKSSWQTITGRITRFRTPSAGCQESAKLLLWPQLLVEEPLLFFGLVSVLLQADFNCQLSSV